MLYFSWIQAAAMFKILRDPPTVPETLSSEGKDFLRCCFQRNPADRPSAAMLLEHQFVKNSQQLDVSYCNTAFNGKNFMVDKCHSICLCYFFFFLSVLYLPYNDRINSIVQESDVKINSVSCQGSPAHTLQKTNWLPRGKSFCSSLQTETPNIKKKGKNK